MNIAEAKQQIMDTVDGYLAQDDTGAYLIPPLGQRPLFLLGAPGIGKTAIVSQVANELGIGLVSYSMTHHTRQSALGLPFIVHRDYGGKSFEVSEYTMSEIIAAVYDYMEETGLDRGILFLDEINCVSETLYPSMLQFLQFKTFGRHRVPDGWVVVCAGNPPEYNKSVYDFDVVTLDRLRKIEVEPDLDAWLDYARATGVHPAVISYLEVKGDQFYSVESTPSGKSFVTARGWDDLSRVIKLFEARGKQVNKTLFEQFLQSDEIAERFAQYYTLFTKYRSDYQIASILDGAPSAQIRERAQAARFDERLALVRLIVDGLEGRLQGVLEEEGVLTTVRDILRESKEALLGGGSVQMLADEAERMAAGAQRLVDLDRATDADVRVERLSAMRLRSYVGACEQERTTEGAAALETVQAQYGSEVSALKEQVGTASGAIDCAFAFIEDAFGDNREMAAFMAELTARPAPARFIGRFGNDAYYAHNATAVQGTGNTDLLTRIEKLDLEAAAAEAARAEASRHGGGCGGCAGC